MDPKAAVYKKMMSQYEDPNAPMTDEEAMGNGEDYSSHAVQAGPEGALTVGKVRETGREGMGDEDARLADAQAAENATIPTDVASYGYGDGTTLNVGPPENFRRTPMDTQYVAMEGQTPPLEMAPMDPKRPWLSERPSSLQQDDGSDPDDGLLAMLGIK